MAEARLSGNLRQKGMIMLKQYQILNDCVRELKSEEQDIGRLQVEIQLYKLKRLLLQDEVAAKLKNDLANEKDFELLREMIVACKGTHNQAEMVKIIIHISQIEKQCTR